MKEVITVLVKVFRYRKMKETVLNAVINTDAVENILKMMKITNVNVTMDMLDIISNTNVSFLEMNLKLDYNEF